MINITPELLSERRSYSAAQNIHESASLEILIELIPRSGMLARKLRSLISIGNQD